MMDYHLHGNFCGHGTGDLEDYVREALKKGIREIGFSAHLPKVTAPDPYHAMLEEDLPRYVEKVNSLAEKYDGEIVIKLGIEADYFEGYEDRTRSLVESYPFDYVIGSLHFIGDWHFTSRAGLPRYREEDPDEVFPVYFELLEKMILSGIFDVVGHPDALKRSFFIPTIPLEPCYRKVTSAIKKMDMAAEVNSAGLRRDAGSIYPSRGFLSVLIEEGVPLTLGSDAHSPEDVGRDLDVALKTIVEEGGGEIALFDKRKRLSVRISSWLNQS